VRELVNLVFLAEQMERIRARQFHCWQQLIEWLCYREELQKMLPPAHYYLMMRLYSVSFLTQ